MVLSHNAVRSAVNCAKALPKNTSSWGPWMAHGQMLLSSLIPRPPAYAKCSASSFALCDTGTPTEAVLSLSGMPWSGDCEHSLRGMSQARVAARIPRAYKGMRTKASRHSTCPCPIAKCVSLQTQWLMCGHHSQVWSPCWSPQQVQWEKEN